MSLDDLAEATKIGKRYLQALERDDFDALPGGVFAKGYIRTCAETLGADPEPLLEAYLDKLRERGGAGPDAEEESAQQAAQAALSRLASERDPGRAGVGRAAWIAAAVVVGAVLLIAAGWWFLRRPSSGPDAAGVVASETAPREEHRRAPSPAVQTPPAPDEGPSEDTTPEDLAARDSGAPAEPPAAEPARSDDSATAGATERSPAAPEVSESSAPAPSSSASTASESALTVAESGVGAGVRDRQLVGRADTFPEGTRVWFWTRVLGGAPGDRIEHVWMHEGTVISVVELNIGAAHWRTQSNHTLRPGSTGHWTVEARDTAGNVLARAAFDCVAADRPRP